jgi:hypothetical protein
MTEREHAESSPAILQEITELARECVRVARENNAALRDVAARLGKLAERSAGAGGA